MMDASDTTFIEMDEASGAPMKPNEKGLGPQTIK
jgi:hypothetical protein